MVDIISDPKNKKNFLAKNFKFLLKLHKMDIKNLSIETKLPATTLSRIKQENSNPTISSLTPLLDFFRIDLDTLLYKDISDQKYNTKNQVGDLVHIPIITIMDVLKWPVNSKLEKFIGAAGITGENVYGIYIENDSLTPMFQANSTIIVTTDFDPLKEGDFVICLLDHDQAPTFRQVYFDGDNYFFKPVNPRYGDLKQHKKFKILGKIIKSLWEYK